MDPNSTLDRNYALIEVLGLALVDPLSLQIRQENGKRKKCFVANSSKRRKISSTSDSPVIIHIPPTTFVQADVSSFRFLVQKLTGRASSLDNNKINKNRGCLPEDLKRDSLSNAEHSGNKSQDICHDDCKLKQSKLEAENVEERDDPNRGSKDHNRSFSSNLQFEAVAQHPQLLPLFPVFDSSN